MILFLAVEAVIYEAYSISLIDGLTNSGFLLIQIRSPVQTVYDSSKETETKDVKRRIISNSKRLQG
jgi:hypothetical protein